MRARLALCAALTASACLLGCSSDSAVDNSVAVTPAESLLGADLLPPDGVVAASTALSAAELPPDTAVTPDDADLPPAS